MSDVLAEALAGEGGDAGSGSGADGEGAGGGEDQGGGGGNGGGGEGGEPWFAGLSDEAADGILSDRKWVENKKWADPAAAIKSHRELEAKFLSGDKIVLPKEGASQEELDTFHAKIGRPESADKYEIKAPEGKKLDEALVGKFRETAFKAGLPAAMATPLVDMFNAHVMEAQEAAEAVRVQAAKDGVAAAKKAWGAAATQNLAASNRAMTLLGLSGVDVDAIGDAMPPEIDDQGEVVKNGTQRWLELLARLGVGMGEDVLGGGGGSKKFGMSGAEAQAKLDEMNADPEAVKKLQAKDPVLTARRAQLIEIVSAFEDAENAKQ